MRAAVTAERREIRVGGYSVVIAHGALREVGTIAHVAAPAHRYAIITDTTVGAEYAATVRRSLGDETTTVYSIPPGEGEKTRQTWASLTDLLLADGFGRDSAIVAVGGGVVGDLAGFVAATFMRGVPLVLVPTTLLAMIDASIGGKTAVDTPSGKNLVGAFHAPAAVIADPAVLHTLPEAQVRAGLAEALKHGVIADERYFGLVSDAARDIARAGASATSLTTPLIAGSVEIKAAVVRRDERESGVRKILNFGHTLGHAIELLSEFKILHGEAVAIGMVLESRLAEELGVAERDTAEQVKAAVSAAGLPFARPSDQDPHQILLATRRDKKARAGVVEYALPARIGAMAAEHRGWTTPIPDALVLEALR